MRSIIVLIFMHWIMSSAAPSANAVVYTDYVQFQPPKVLSGQGAFNWSHAVTADFQVPFDTVNSANLTLTANRSVGKNNYLTILNFNFGTIDFNSAATDSGDVLTVFNLGSFGRFTTQFGWKSGQPLDLSLVYNQGPDISLTLLSSLFRLDYNNIEAPIIVQTAGDQVVPVPEPGTLLLFGGGLVGLALLKRKGNG